MFISESEYNEFLKGVPNGLFDSAAKVHAHASNTVQFRSKVTWYLLTLYPRFIRVEMKHIMARTQQVYLVERDLHLCHVSSHRACIYTLTT
jgi:hypothetical protein